jgi:thiamine monophosphate synthase
VDGCDVPADLPGAADAVQARLWSRSRAGLAALAAAAPRAYALGGVLPAHVAGCLAPPVRGIAVMRPIMRCPQIPGLFGCLAAGT